MADLFGKNISNSFQDLVTLGSSGLLEDGRGTPLVAGGMSNAQVGAKTVTNTPAAVFAGSAAKAGRTHLTIKVVDADIRICIGTGSANLERDGLPVEPGQTVSVPLSKEQPADIYAVSEGAHVTINILEY